MVEICLALAAVLPRWKIQTLQPQNFFLKLLFPHWTCFHAVRKHRESRGEFTGLKLTISKHCCPNSCRNSTAVSSPLEYCRERLFSPPDSAACWMVPAGMQLRASQSAWRTAGKPGKSISRVGNQLGSLWGPPCENDVLPWGD